MHRQQVLLFVLVVLVVPTMKFVVVAVLIVSLLSLLPLPPKAHCSINPEHVALSPKECANCASLTFLSRLGLGFSKLSAYRGPGVIVRQQGSSHEL